MHPRLLIYFNSLNLRVCTRSTAPGGPSGPGAWAGKPTCYGLFDRDSAGMHSITIMYINHYYILPFPWSCGHYSLVIPISYIASLSLLPYKLRDYRRRIFVGFVPIPTC